MKIRYIFWLLLTACSPAEPTIYGYVDNDLLYLAPNDSGYLHTISVAQGDIVRSGTVLFTLNINEAQAPGEKVDYLLNQQTLLSPTEASVHDIYFKAGAFVAAGVPVLSLIQKNAFYAVFYVPQPQISYYKVGQKITLYCQGCNASIGAKVTYISPQVEYISPFISGETNDAAYSFKIKALVDDTQQHLLSVGQNVWTYKSASPLSLLD